MTSPISSTAKHQHIAAEGAPMSGAVLVSVLGRLDLGVVDSKYRVPNGLRPYTHRPGAAVPDFCSSWSPLDKIGAHENDNGVPTKDAPYSTMSYPLFHPRTFEPLPQGKQRCGRCVNRMRRL